MSAAAELQARMARFAADPLAGRRVLLGVSGSIAAYKALTIASRATQAGAEVDVILTRAAGELLRPLAFQALTHRPVALDLWDPRAELAMDHVALARGAEVFLVAPATADVMARLALGLADDALTTTALAVRAPTLLAPAMEPRMWSHPATQGHAATLRARGVDVLEPREGRMASGERGRGRMREPEELVERLRIAFAASGPLAGRRLLVTAGPTREAIDPVRFLSNGSTGTMGLAIARLARDLGAEVRLVHGPISGSPPLGVDARAVTTAAEMRDAVLEAAPAADALVMCAAVADYRPARAAARKIKKRRDGEGEDDGVGDRLAMDRLEWVRTDDVLATLDDALRRDPPSGRAPLPLRVGFAAETERLLENARGKLTRKGLDLVVANAVPQSFGPGRVEATLVSQEDEIALPPLDKRGVAAALLAWLHERLAERAS